MSDIDKFIQTMEKAKKKSKEYGLDEIRMTIEFADTLVELMKEKEPVEPINTSSTKIRTENKPSDWFTVGRCPVCGHGGLNNQDDKYCGGCGRRLRWREHS